MSASSLVNHVARAIGAAQAKHGGPIGAHLWDVDLISAAKAAIEAYRQPGTPPQDMAPHEEVECALALFRNLKQTPGEYRAVKVEAPAFWNVVTPRTQEALLAALETTERAQFAEQAAEAVDGWQDIATAPKDGTRVLLWQPGHEPCCGGWFAFDGVWLTDRSMNRPTHWMEILPPPDERG